MRPKHRIEEMGWPAFDSDIEHIYTFCLEMSLEELQLALESLSTCAPPISDHDSWIRQDMILDESGRLAESLKLPCNPTYHQQPYDLRHLFPFVWLTDSCDDDEMLVSNRVIFLLWVYRFRKLASELEPVGALRQMRRVTLKLVHYFGNENGVERKILLSQSLDWFDWFEYTDGCFDIRSGALIDRELPALREFEAKTRRDTVRAKRSGARHEG
jgi:hypothetical protein